MKPLYSKIFTLLLTLTVGLIATPAALGAATIVIQNNDAPNVGFNDPTPASPIGGNNGTTVGQQRLIAFQFAASIWGATLTSGPTITVRANWAALPCEAITGVLGSAGATANFRNFPGAPFPNTLYNVALANALSNSDLNGATAEIAAQFNSSVGTTGCLEASHWYYGLDANEDPGGIDLVAVLLHELGHGLGFQTFTSSSTGSQSSGFPSIYDRFLFDTTQNKTWPQMTNAERAASAINTGNLVWIGQQVLNDIPGMLSTPRLRVNSPSSIAGNYQIGTAGFGPKLTSSGVTADVAQALDPSDSAGPATTDACSPLTNPAAVAGKFALIDRGTCTFVSKVKNAQNAGAIGVIIVDNTPANPPVGLAGSDTTITIPAARVTQADGNTIKAQLAAGVNATLLLDGSTPGGADSLGRPRLYAPNPVEGGSSIAHWDTSLYPNQLMEPNLSGDLSHSVLAPQDLSYALLRDIGWCVACPPPPNDSKNRGPMTNGATHTGVIGISGLDTWTFQATQNDGINLSIGEVLTGADPGFVPWIRLRGPDGTPLGDDSGVQNARIDLRAPQTGTYTVLVASNTNNQSGPGNYAVTLAKTAGPYAISSGDEGGPLTIGAKHAGLIGIGDLDAWSFQAAANDRILVSIDEVPPTGADPGFVPWIRLRGPDGVLVDNQSNLTSAKIDVFAPQTGIYTVVVESNTKNQSGPGSYLLSVEGPQLTPAQLLLETSGPVAGAATALDSMLFLRDPFPVVNVANTLNAGPDRNTRVIVFVTNLQLAQGESASSVVVNLIDSSSQSHDVAAEDVRLVPNYPFTQVLFRLPDNLPAGTCTIRIKAHGQVSNAGTIRIGI